MVHAELLSSASVVCHLGSFTVIFLLSVNLALVWPGCNGQGVGLRHKRSRVRLPAVPLSADNLGQAVYTHAPLSQAV